MSRGVGFDFLGHFFGEFMDYASLATVYFRDVFLPAVRVLVAHDVEIEITLARQACIFAGEFFGLVVIFEPFGGVSGSEINSSMSICSIVSSEKCHSGS